MNRRNKYIHEQIKKSIATATKPLKSDTAIYTGTNKIIKEKLLEANEEKKIKINSRRSKRSYLSAQHRNHIKKKPK